MGTGSYETNEDFRRKNLLNPELPDDHPNESCPDDHTGRNSRYPSVVNENDDDEEIGEPETKRARTFVLIADDLKHAGVNEVDAKNCCNAILGSASEASFAELYGREAIVNEANGPRRNLGVKGLSAFDLRTMRT